MSAMTMKDWVDKVMHKCTKKWKKLYEYDADADDEEQGSVLSE